MNQRGIGNLIELSSENGYIHKIGTDTYFKKGIISDNIDNYEEVSEMPKYTRKEYIDKVRELIKEKYDIEDEIAIHRQKDTKPDEYQEYNNFVEDCKIKAKSILNNG